MNRWHKCGLVATALLLSSLSQVADAQSAANQNNAGLSSLLDDKAPSTTPESGPQGPAASAEKRQDDAAGVKTETADTPAKSSLGISTIEEIIVTAQKREENINSVPIAISAFTGKDLKTLGITDTRDLSKLVPGFTYGDSGYAVPVYSIRGIGFNDPSQTASSTVGVYVDQFNLPFPIFSKGPNLDIKRVEVLKGPQGTLFGRNTTGGLINYITNQPTQTLEFGTTTSYGRFNTVDTENYVSGPITDTVNARLAYRGIFSFDGWQRSNTRYPGGHYDTLGKQDKQAARLTLNWKPVDWFRASLALSGWTDRSQPQAPQAIGIRPQGVLGQLGLTESVRNYPLVPFDSDDNRVADWAPNLDFRLAEKFAMAALRTDWDLTDTMTLSFLGAFEDFNDNHSFIPQSGFNFENAERELIDHTNADSFELHLAGKPGHGIHWLLGGFLSHDRVNDFQRIYDGTDSAGFPIPIMLPVIGQFSGVGSFIDSIGRQTADTRAAFANLDWEFVQDFKLDLGVRYTTEKRRFTGCIADDATATNGAGLAPIFDALALIGPVQRPGTPLPTQLAVRGDCVSINQQTNNPGAYTGTLEEPNVSYRTALDWTPADDSLLYVSYSRGFKSGSFPVLPSSSQDQYKPVTEEKLNAYEVGGKLAFFERQLRVNFAAFYYDYRNKQLIGRIKDPIFGPLPILVNAPKSKVEGLELGLTSSPISGLFLSVNALYLRTVLGSYRGIDESGTERDLSGKPFNFAPRTSITVLADYEFPVSDTYSLGFGGDYSYRSSTNAVLTQDPLYAINDYSLVNLHVDVISRQDWRVSAFCRNLTDSFYSVGTVNSGDGIARFTGQPRTYGVTFSYNYR